MNRPLLPACLLAVLLAGVLTGQSAAAQGARVDLNLFYDAPVVPAGGDGTQTFTVTNSGADATGPADLTITTAVFVQADHLPRACGFLYRASDPDATVPEVIRCVIPPLAHADSAGVMLPVTVDGAAGAGETYGTATVLPTDDVEQHMADNLGFPSMVVSDPASVAAPAGGHVADVYVTTDLPAVAIGQPAPETLTVGNRGPQATTGPVRLVLATPPLVRVDESQALPAGCGFLYDSPDPAAPQLVRCTVPAPLPTGRTVTVRLPLTPVFGSPVQTSWGVADAFPDRAAGSTDVDPVPANNLVESGVQVIG